MRKGWILVGLFLVSIVLANFLILWLGPPAVIPVAFLLIGLDLSVRDALHEYWKNRHLLPKMAALVAAGSTITYAINQDAASIAIASLVAFAVALTVDGLIYQAVYSKTSRLGRMNLSNIGSAAVDSIIFPTLAFGVFMPLIILGQWAAKVLGGAIWAWALEHGQ